MATDRLRITEIFHSIQGEGTRAGVRCVFVRLTGCHLRCTYCDTAYAFYEGGWMTLDEIMDRVRGLSQPAVEGARGDPQSESTTKGAGGRPLLGPAVGVTGGEPLLQPAVYPLMRRLADEFTTVMLETSGAVLMDKVDPRVVRIMDVKCPSSGEAHRNEWGNIALLTPRDEVKFVVGDRADFEWARSVIAEHGLLGRCPVLMNPVFERVTPAELAGWVLADRLDVRMGVQLHKVIWAPTARGV